MAHWFVIAAESATERSDCILDLVQRLSGHGIAVGGFTQTVGADGRERPCQRLTRIGSDERLLLATAGVVPRQPSDQPFCDYVFAGDAFARAAHWLRDDAARCPVLTIDAVSKLEAQGLGHAASVRWALALDDRHAVLLGVRSRVLFEVVEHFGLDRQPLTAIEAPLDEPKRLGLAAQLLDLLRAAH